MAIPLFDAHCDTLSRLLAEPEQHLLGNGGQWDLSRTGGLAPQAQIFAAFADSRLPGPWSRRPADRAVSPGVPPVFRSDCPLHQRAAGSGSGPERASGGLFIGGGRRVAELL